MEENTLIGNADSLYFKPIENESGMNLELNQALQSNLVSLIQDRFTSAEESRDHDERRWLQAYHNYRGLYPKNVKLFPRK